VSPETANDLASLGRERLKADLCLSITGIAGPSGAIAAFDGRPAKPVGLVLVGLSASPKAASGLGLEDVSFRAFQHQGDRALVREWSIRTALAMLWQALNRRTNVRLLREIDWPSTAQRIS
jgi:nicotinamide-nucleotide amidase